MALWDRISDRYLGGSNPASLATLSVAQGRAQHCRRALRLGQGPTCQGQLDELALHAEARARQDHIAQYARTAGVTASKEEARPADDAPRHAQPMHTADVRVMDNEANTTWIDIMVTAAQPARPIMDSLKEAETRKCRE